MEATTQEVARTPVKERETSRSALRPFLRNGTAMTAAAILFGLLVTATIGPSLVPYDPLAMDMTARMSPPSAAHPLGTDDFGRDLLSRIVYGSQVSLMVSVFSIGISVVLGTLPGLLAGFYRGWMDELLMRVMDVMMAFPAIVLGIAIVSVLGLGTRNLIIAIGIVYTPVFARVVRGAVLAVRELEFVEAARAMGARDARIIVRHVLPNVLAPLIVQVSLCLSWAFLIESSLSFLGLGTQPPYPAWGKMLAEARGFMELAPWMAVFPGLAIMLAVLGFNLFGDGLRDALDPRLRF